ncbi:pappalysin-1 isoform X1 [Monodelphis domestica]|uniref:pappalysin-1 isoform X1 n=1 Tax=Monodelphis domestica TaxID=13616 RepID=UPI0024E1A3DB|nr:pappalysin-1 isoform X1 [Monodelphis domestica]
MQLWSLVLTLGLLCGALASGAECGMDERSRRARRDTRPSRHLHSAAPGTCATRLARGRHSPAGWEPLRAPRRRQQREVKGEEDSLIPSRALYFSGQGDQLRLKADIELPRDAFTLQVWLRAEGGQRSPAVIAGLYDKCSYTSRDRGWAVGIHTISDQGNRDPRYFFSMKTDRARKVTTINAHRSYLPSQWVHLAATYDGRLMKLYVNGAQVAMGSEQVGGIFSPLTLKCKVLMLGGNALNHNYRGYIEHFSLWKTARSQKEILLDMGRANHGLGVLPHLVIQENLENVRSMWSSMKDGNSPQVEFSYHHGLLLDTSLEPPLCGQTLCDNVEVIASYNRLPSFRRPKLVRYRVVNIYDDNHENPTVSQQQIEFQHQQLTEAFDRYNITWQLEVLEVKNSSLRHRLILANCDISKIGDENCDPECNHTLTGYDGGDCRHLRHSTFSKKKQNGVCDMDCNYERYSFDGGECCNPEITDVTKTCFDPDSPYRAYLDVNELKNILKLDGSTHLNIFFANSSEEELAGVATWPWDKEALMHLGGIVLNPSFYGIPGHTHTMTHEIGHSLGLYHIFRGISEIQSCSDPCMETEPSFETGDLCSDTNPAPKHKLCGDPAPGNDTCGFRTFLNTPYNNFMSYAEDDCTDSFTPNQVARMHCYLDLVYQSWQPAKKPAPIALMPQIVDRTPTSVTLEWFPPIDGHFFEREVGSACDLCLEGRVLVQYAFNASSPMPCDPSGHWSPREAEGHPDVEQPCKSSVRTWSPNSAVNHHTVPPACPEPQGCYLELEFQYPLIPESLTVWVTLVSTDWDSSGAVNDIKLLTLSGKNISLGPQNIFCDIPLTIKIRDVGEEVYGIQIYTLDEHLEIDAAMLTSIPESPLCRDCKPLKYKVLRDPPFQSDIPIVISNLNRRYIDTELNHGSTYKYQIVTISGSEESEPSPTAIYIHGSGYCGDGIIQKHLGEECDDMNKMNGDGCSLFCRKELYFNCIDEPSRCYFHDGDGVCEEFEQKTSIKDCGVYTPKGFLDQWASNVSVSHQDQKCPGWVIIGQPAASQMCRTKVVDLSEEVSQHAWYPCTINYQYSYMVQTTFWLKAFFSQPMVATAVIVHLVTDGTNYLDQKQETISVQLLDTKEQNHDLGVHVLSCRSNPLIIPVIHDLSHPFYHSQAVLVSFSSPLVAISGVALRSFYNFDPITISSCQRGETYSPAEQSCVHFSCEATDCQELNIENASLNCSNSERYNGAQCTISCKMGYILQIHRDDDLIKSQSGSSITVTCTEGKWNKQVSCEPVDCGIPDQYHVYPATFSCLEGTTFGKKCSFQCRPPAQLKGNNSFLTCMEDGLWSFPEALCELMCLAPPIVPNADLQTARCREDKHKVGSFCKFKCKPGYHVPGSSRKSKKRAFKIQCIQDGSWLEGGCVPVTCDPPPPMFHGLYQCTNGFQFNSECRIKCEESGISLGRGSNVIHCRKDGTWSGSFHVCKEMQGQCSLPDQLNSNLKLQCSDGYEIGAECSTSCPDHNSESIILPMNMTIRDIPYWMNPTRVERVICTAGLKWYPHPSMIHCVKGCEPFMGDNYCDAINNRAFCNYDGGDCCASTVKTKKVTPFPMSCDLQGDCACRDPKAQEHGRKDLRAYSHG